MTMTFWPRTGLLVGVLGSLLPQGPAVPESTGSLVLVGGTITLAIVLAQIVGKLVDRLGPPPRNGNGREIAHLATAIGKLEGALTNQANVLGKISHQQDLNQQDMHARFKQLTDTLARIEEAA